MLLTITMNGTNTQELGYLLHKNPQRAQCFELNFGKAYVFYTEVSDNRTTAALLLELNPIDLAHKQNVHAVAIVLNLPKNELLKRNAARADRGYPERVIKKHCADLRRSVKHLKKEGFRFIYVMNSQEEVNNAEIVRTKLWNDKKDDHGAFDIIGDIHGCYDELVMLLGKLGYQRNEQGVMVHPCGRKAAFLGDLCDRGTKNTEVLRLVMDMVKSGNAVDVPGNHDVKLLKYLRGKNVQMTHGLDITVSQLEKENDDFRNEVAAFLDGLVSHYVLDDGKLVISHAGIKKEYIGRSYMKVRDFCLYGETTGETDEYGLPVRLDWGQITVEKRLLFTVTFRNRR
ncbi:MAG: metallophosphoesterase [Acutalibacteraceae bacterium]